MKPGDRVRLNAVGRDLATSEARKWRHGTLVGWHCYDLERTAWVRWDGLRNDQAWRTEFLESAL